MANDKKLVIKINADNSSFKARLNEAKLETEKLNKSFSDFSKKSAKAFAAISVAIGGNVLAFRNFEKQFTQVETLLDKSSFSTKSLENGIDDLRKGVLDLRAASGESFESLNKGLFDLVSAGVPAEDAITTLTAATNLAAAGATDVSTAVDGMTTAMNAFGIDASQAEEISQKFFFAQKEGKTTIAELSNSIGAAASSAASFGVSFEEVLAATAATTLAGKTASESLTGLNQVFVNIAKPTADAAKEAERLGVEFNSAALRSKGLEGFLSDLVKAEGFTTKSIERLFGSVEAMSVAFALTGKQSKAFNETLKSLQDEALLTETFNNALAKSNETVDKALSKLKGSFNAILVVLGEQFAPLIISIADKLNGFARKILNADKEILAKIKTISVFIASAAGIATALASAGAAIIVFKNLIRATGIQLLFTSKVAKVFWSAVFPFGRVAKIAAGLATLTAGFLGFKQAVKEDDSKTVVDSTEEKINSLLEEQNRLDEKRIESGEVAAAEAQRKIDAIQAEIDKLLELKGVKDSQLEADSERREESLEKEGEFQEREQERLRAHREKMEAIQRESDARLQASDKFIKKMQKDQGVKFNKDQKKELQDHLLGKSKTTNKFLLESISEQEKTDARFLKMQDKYGTTFAKVDKAFNNKKLQGAKDTANKFIYLKESENKAVAAIGKAAALINIGIDTAKGAISAYSALAGIPIVGPALGAAAAAAVVAFGAEQTANVLASGAVKGGYVSKGQPGKDDQPFMLSRGESVIPADITPELFNTFEQLRNLREGGGLSQVLAGQLQEQLQGITPTVFSSDSISVSEDNEEANRVVVDIELQEDVTDFITAQQRENQDLGIGIL